MVRGEKWCDLCFPHLLVCFGDDFVQIDEADVKFIGNLPRPSAIGIFVAHDLAVFPVVARNGRAEDGSCALGERIFYILAHVPAVGVHCLLLFHDGVPDVACFIPNAGESSACTRSIIEWTGVVVAKLHDDVIAGFNERKGFIPESFCDEGAAAAPPACTIDYVDLREVEVFGQNVTPSPKPIGAGAISVAYGGVAYKKQRR